MPLSANATLTFTRYNVTDAGIDLWFTCDNPGGGMPSDYQVGLTDAELAGVSTVAQLKTLVTNKLSRRYRATGISTKLDALLGQSVVI
jgi:hypothetical protein